MVKAFCRVGIAAIFLLSAIAGHGAGTPHETFRFNSVDGLEVRGGRAEVATYKGRKAVRLIPATDHDGPEDSILAILTSTNLKEGVIEAEIAGSPRPGTPPDERGFVGIAFHVQKQGALYECFYLRPTNGRADEQLRRNHSTQYVSEPAFPWYRLRSESPGSYESYVDLESGAWTRVKIVIAGNQARLYVNGAAQPALIVRSLKLGQTQGPVALWAHWSTDAYFSQLSIE